VKRLAQAFLVAAVMSAPASAQNTPRDLRDMVGARAGQAEGELQRRGYRNVRGEKGDDRSYTYWWNDTRQQCVTIATMQGRYDSITVTPAPDCRQSSRSDGDGERSWRNDRRGSAGSDYQPAGGDLSRFCKGEAAAAFDRRPSDITVNLPIRQPRGTIVQGWFDRPGGTRFFTCRFDESGRFLSVM
jgi:hypothetical protein